MSDRTSAGRPNFVIDRSQRRIGPIWLTPGIGPVNVLTLFFAGMMTIIFVTGIGVLTPYLLNEHIKMPTSEQGNFIGTLTVYIEIIAIALVIPLGALSDKVGRVYLWTGAFVLVAIACILLPAARTPEMFMLGRILMGAGFATGTLMLGTVMADYPQNASRGKIISINGFITGVGVVLVAAIGFSLLPGLFADRGFDAVTAGTYAFWVIAAIATAAALVTLAGLKDGRPEKTEEKDPFRVNLKNGFEETKDNPRLSIAGFAYFVSRGDLIVMTTFLTLWIVAVGTDAGMETTDATKTAGRIFAVSQTAMLLFMPVMGFLVDRFDRVTVLSLSMGIAAVGYCVLGIAGDPYTSPFIFPVAILAGAGEACILVSGPALVGQEATGKRRGAVFGMMGFCGALGVLIHSKVCGMLFDGFTYQTPFLYMASLNALVALGALIVRLRTGSQHVAQPTAAE
ncbi:MAG: MFS transporter [Rhodospirillaceae bacterium]|nr:MFS transporter [Rhodospirillaceae bacterium]